MYLSTSHKKNQLVFGSAVWEMALWSLRVFNPFPTESNIGIRNYLLLTVKMLGNEFIM